eukprot:1142564-Pelagomonas_calceolata.AAC.2
MQVLGRICSSRSFTRPPVPAHSQAAALPKRPGHSRRPVAVWAHKVEIEHQASTQDIIIKL